MSETVQKIRYVALAGRVLAVAVKGSIEDWAAYIDAVPGIKHQEEAELVAQKGTKLPYWMARKLFPDFDNKYAWRE